MEIRRDGAPKAETRKYKRVEFETTWTPAHLFRILGIDPPPEGTDVHILIARSHGDEGSLYAVNNGSLVCDVRVSWNERVS